MMKADFLTTQYWACPGVGAILTEQSEISKNIDI